MWRPDAYHTYFLSRYLDTGGNHQTYSPKLVFDQGVLWFKVPITGQYFTWSPALWAAYGCPWADFLKDCPTYNGYVFDVIGPPWQVLSNAPQVFHVPMCPTV